MIELKNLGKTYRSWFGRRVVNALDDLTLSMDRGEVLGIAGLNGAGKSTLISLLLGYLTPTHGSIRIEGYAPRAYIERHGAGYLDELLAIPPRWTVESTLRRVATLAGIPRSAIRSRVEEMLERMELSSQRSKRIHELSKGNMQRVGLGQALIGDRDLIILDEPTYGLDPVWCDRFRHLVRESRRPSRLIIIASHNLDELERLADRVIILHQGRLQQIVTPDSLLTRGVPRTYRLKLTSPHAALPQLLPHARPVEGRLDEWHVEGDLITLNRALSSLVATGVVVDAFAPEAGRLEHEFRIAIGTHHSNGR